MLLYNLQILYIYIYIYEYFSAMCHNKKTLIKLLNRNNAACLRLESYYLKNNNSFPLIEILSRKITTELIVNAFFSCQQQSSNKISLN
jgi:hypothetical protein